MFSHVTAIVLRPLRPQIMQPLVALVLAVCSLAGLILARELEDEEFLQWRNSYHQGKDVQWSSYRVWKNNAEFVRKQNSLGLSYTVAMNEFGHMTIDELVKGKLKNTDGRMETSFSDLQSTTPLPPSVDWRKKGVVVPVQNQGQCGTSDSFGVVDAIDSFVAIETGTLVGLSIEEYYDCCDRPTPCSQCGGGGLFPEEGFECVAEIGGLSGAEYHSPHCVCLNATYKPIAKINGGKQVQRGNETALAFAVAMQPVAAAIDASHMSFQFYSGGIYDEPYCSTTALDHVVLIVGYGSEGGQDYWIVQNSWGTNWGMKGYILMSRNKNNQCGIATAAAYPY